MKSGKDAITLANPMQYNSCNMNHCYYFNLLLTCKNPEYSEKGKPS